MEERAVRRNVAGYLAVLCAFALAVAFYAAVHPTAALAEETGVAYSVDSNGTRHYYSTIDEAKKAGYSGAVIIMSTDWDLGSGSLDINDSQSITIQTAGHKITSSNGDATIYVNEHASVTITSNVDATPHSYNGYAKKGSYLIGTDKKEYLKNNDWEWRDLTVTTSGLVTNTNRSFEGGAGVRLEKGAKVTLENVAVAGCGNSGIYMKDDATASLANATVCHNNFGGGVHLGDGCTLNLNASHVDDNYRSGGGGGIYAGSGAHIYLEKSSTISGNGAVWGGGGVYFNNSFFTLKSSDATGVISGNASYEDNKDSAKANRDGGGVHVDESHGNNEGLIEGIAIKGNYAGHDGGGIMLYQRWTTVRNCSITDNVAGFEGGGARVSGGNNTFENCTVTGNICDYKNNGKAGGGIEVDNDYDVILRGTCIVKNNKRNSDGSADDVYLDRDLFIRAYIKGSLSQGSSVGVRPDGDDDVRVAKNFSHESNDCLFSNLLGCRITYGTDEGGDAWQRNGMKEFTATLDSKNPTKYMQGSKVALVAPRTKGDNLVFWHWDLDKTTGLYPISDYISTSDASNKLFLAGAPQSAFNNTLGFMMPQNDVDAVPVYTTRAKKMGVSVKAPVAGEALPASAEVYRLDGAGLRGPFSASVTWYEVGSDGGQTRASGVAKAGTAYVAEISLKANDRYGLYFNSSISAQDVTLTAASGSAPAVEAASVDSQAGRLTVKTGTFAKTAGEAADVNAGKVKIKVKKKPLLDGGEAQAAVLSDEDGLADGNDSDDAAGDEFEVSYTYSSDSDEVTLTAPGIEGYNFCYWEGIGSEQIDDDTSVKVPVSTLASIKELTACYAPVATRVVVDIDVPKAGDKLDETAGDVKLACRDDSLESFAEAFGLEKGNFAVTWLPESEDGKADYSTTYTALIELGNAEGIENIEDALADEPTVTCNNGMAATSAGFVVIDGKICLALSFPATDAVKVTSVSQPAYVELTFEQAAGYAADQATHPDTLCWPLPKTVAVTLENGEVVDGDVTWEIPAGFDAAATGAQELTAKGTVSIASEDEIDASGVSLDVSTTIKVAAPEQGGSGTPAVNPDNGGSQPSNDNTAANGNTTGNDTKAGNGNTASTKAGAASASAKTGDSLPIAAAAATVAVAAIVAAVAIAAITRRRES